MNILDMDKKIFEEKLNGESALLVEFWAPWCVYCKRIGPAFSKIAEQYEGKLQIGRINIDEEEAIMEQEKIQVVPSLVLYKDGKAAALLEAPDSKAKMEAFIEENLNK